MSHKCLTFRRAEESDLPAIVKLLVDDSLGRMRELPDLPLDLGYVEGFHAIEADPNQFLSIAAMENDIVGTLQISFIPGVAQKGVLRGQIEAVRIARTLRGQGIGRQYMQWAIEQCRERGCGFVQLTMNKSREDTYRFYTRLGFTPSHEGFKLYF